MRIEFGQKVTCSGGEPGGEVTAVVIDTLTREITHIALGNGRLVAHDWLIPLNEVQGNTEDGLLLHARAEQLPAMPQFVPWLEIESEETARSAGAGLSERPQATPTQPSKAIQERKNVVLLRRNCPVYAVDGHVGSLSGLLTDTYDNRLSSIIMAPGLAFAKPTGIPVQWVDEIQSSCIKLATSVGQAKSLVGPEAGAYVSTEQGSGSGQAPLRERWSEGGWASNPDQPFGGEL